MDGGEEVHSTPASVVVENLKNGNHRCSAKSESINPPSPDDEVHPKEHSNDTNKGMDLRMEDEETNNSEHQRITTSTPVMEVEDARSTVDGRELSMSPTHSVELSNGDRGEVSLGLGGVPLFTCTQCEFTSNSAHLLHQHMRMHIGKCVL